MRTHGVDPGASGAPSAGGSPQGATPGSRYKWAVMTVVGSGIFMATLDASIVNVSLPTMARDFGVDLPAVQWVVLAYAIGLTSLMLTMGSLADIAGRKRIYLAGMVIFGAGSALCGLSPGVWWLVGARVVQSVGGAMLQANAAALVVTAFPASERGRALGITGSIVSIGLLTGPLAGGLIVGAAGWPFIFLINVPVAVIAVVVGVRLLRESVGAPGRTFDYLGAICLGLWVVALVFALNQGEERGWGSPLIVLALALFVGFFLAFVAAENKAKHPTVELSVFRVRMFSMSVGAAFVAFTALASSVLLTPFLLQNMLGFPVARVGLIMATVPAVSAAIAPVGGAMVDRVGARIPALAGMLMMSGGLASLASVGPGSSGAAIVARLALIGAGTGLFMSPNSSTIMSSLPSRRLGLAGGFLAWSRTLGFATGQAVWGAVFVVIVTSFAGVATTLGAPPDASLAGFKTVYFAAAALMLAAALISGARGRIPQPKDEVAQLRDPAPTVGGTGGLSGRD